jgi:anhydro-N-acetylmuramic acid kinase
VNETRLILGLSVGAGLEGVDAAAVRIRDVGLSSIPRIEQSMRVPFAPELRHSLRMKANLSPRAVGEAMAAAARRLGGAEVFCIGLLTPPGGAFATAAEVVADQTGATVMSSFAARDIAAGGAGGPLTPVADYLLARSDDEDRVLLHLGAVTTLTHLPAGGRLGETLAFDVGPGHRFLDAIVDRCTREKEQTDAGGMRAVQGRVHESLIANWSRHSYFHRKPPKTIHRGEFDDAFLTLCIDEAKREAVSLNDLLCTVNHLIARSVANAVREWLPASSQPRGIYLSGGASRNGFLRQLLAQRFPDSPPQSTDEIGVPALARKAATAAILAGLTLDGVTGNLPQLTGATGGRLMGRIIPGDPRNWARVAAWAAEQMWDYVQDTRAA